MSDRADFLHQQGRLLQIQKQLGEAEKAYLQALSIKPNQLTTINNLAVLYRHQGEFRRAELLLGQGLISAAKEWQTSENPAQLAEDWARLLNSSCLLALDQGNYQQALQLGKMMLQLAPEGVGYINLGVALDLLGCDAASERSHLQGLQRHRFDCDPQELIGKPLDDAQASTELQSELSNLATSRLRLNPLHWHHWQLLLSRLGTDPSIWTQTPLPWENLWEGAHIKKLLIWDEQGFGDALQCLRWIPLACERVEEVTVMLRPSLIRLVDERLEHPSHCHVQELPIEGPPLTSSAIHCPLMALPVALYRSHEGINPWPASMQDKSLLTTTFKALTSPQPHLPRRIGLVWQAGQKAEANAQRSSDLRSLPSQLLLEHALRWQQKWSVELFSLQLGNVQGDLEPWIAKGSISEIAEGGDWATTAELVEHLDLVVSVDTAMVHLAGNLGVPCLILLNAVHDWRWGSSHTPLKWYPKQTILRCRKINDWEFLLNEAESILSALIYQ